MIIDLVSIFLPIASSSYFYAILSPSIMNLAWSRIAITFVKGNLSKIWFSSSKVGVIGWEMRSLIIYQLSMRRGSCFILKLGSNHDLLSLFRLFFSEAAFIAINYDSLRERVGLKDY